MANYTAGTITLTNGSKAVVGTGTAWQAALIVGGIIYPEAAGGNAMPFSTVVDDTHITADVAWKGASGTYSYSLAPDTAYNRQVLANANALAQILQQLKSLPIAALSALSPAPDKIAYFNGANTAALTDFTSFARSLLNDPDQAAALTTLGAQPSLGFTPIQQGGGPNQGTNKVKIGWGAAASKLLLQIDNTDFAGSWPISVAGDAATLAGNSVAALYAAMGGSRSSAANGYAILPGGAKFMWGKNAVTTNASGDFSVLFPTSFSSFRQITAMNGDYTVGGALSFAENVSGGQPGSGFNARAYAGTTPVASSGIWVAWHALGV